MPDIILIALAMGLLWRAWVKRRDNPAPRRALHAFQWIRQRFNRPMSTEQADVLASVKFPCC